MTQSEQNTLTYKIKQSYCTQPLHRSRSTIARPEQCNKCQKTFPDQESLARHITNMHQPLKRKYKDPLDALSSKSLDDWKPTPDQYALKKDDAVEAYFLVKEADDNVSYMKWCHPMPYSVRQFRRWRKSHDERITGISSGKLNVTSSQKRSTRRKLIPT